jgi:hypothetical protein
MIDYCKRSGIGMSSAVSDALRAFVAQKSQDATFC